MPATWDCERHNEVYSDIRHLNCFNERDGVGSYMGVRPTSLQGESMDAFNLAAGLVSFVSLAFAIWAELRKKTAQQVEAQKVAAYRATLEAVDRQLSAIGVALSATMQLSDREEVSKKELKHLALFVLNDVGLAQGLIRQDRSAMEQWRFGVPSAYIAQDVVVDRGEFDKTRVPAPS
jgi:hypothetical protein